MARPTVLGSPERVVRLEEVLQQGETRAIVRACFVVLSRHPELSLTLGCHRNEIHCQGLSLVLGLDTPERRRVPNLYLDPYPQGRGLNPPAAGAQVWGGGFK